MFYIIKPAQHKKYFALVDAYRTQLANTHNEIISDEDHLKTTYILDYYPNRGVVGGVYLTRKLTRNYNAHQRHILKPYVKGGQLWQVSGLFFNLPSPDSSLSSPDVNTMCRSFYRNIYETFVNFAVIEDIDFLLAKLSPEDIDDSLYFGFWPYLSSYIPYDDDSDIYYNVLSLHSLDYQTFQLQWGRYDRHEIAVPHQGANR
ncbi:MAG: hypothetical protein ACRYGR_07480 [Janthinobacterium lividum]